MAIEKRWEQQGPIAFTADGTDAGLVTVSSVQHLKVKQKVVISATGEPDLALEVKRVLSLSQLIVGPKQDDKNRKINNLNLRQDISTYTVLKNATIRAEEQSKVTIPEKDIIQAVYEFEPTVAIRTVGVDKLGNPWDPQNPVPITGSIDVEVDLDKANSQQIQNINISTANTEFIVNLPNNTKRYFLKVRNAESKMRLAFISGETVNNYIDISRGAVFDSKDINLSLNSTIYMQTDKANVVLEVLSLVKV